MAPAAPNHQGTAVPGQATKRKTERHYHAPNPKFDPKAVTDWGDPGVWAELARNTKGTKAKKALKVEEFLTGGYTDTSWEGFTSVYELVCGPDWLRPLRQLFFADKKPNFDV